MHHSVRFKSCDFGIMVAARREWVSLVVSVVILSIISYCSGYEVIDRPVSPINIQKLMPQASDAEMRRVWSISLFYALIDFIVIYFYFKSRHFV